MINYCFCQAFSHWECGWQGPLYVAIHTILFIWWCYRVVKAKRIKVRRRMERQKRKKRVELRVLRLIAWLNDGYARKSPKLKPDDAPGEEEEPPGQWMDRFSRREFDIKPEPRFSRNYWRSWSTPPYVGLNQPKN